MDKKNFTFSIQEAETLGIECAIVLAAAKKIDNNLNLNIEHETAIKEMEIIHSSI